MMSYWSISIGAKTAISNWPSPTTHIKWNIKHSTPKMCKGKEMKSFKSKSNRKFENGISIKQKSSTKLLFPFLTKWFFFVSLFLYHFWIKLNGIDLVRQLICFDSPLHWPWPLAFVCWVYFSLLSAFNRKFNFVLYLVWRAEARSSHIDRFCCAVVFSIPREIP